MKKTKTYDIINIYNNVLNKISYISQIKSIVKFF